MKSVRARSFTEITLLEAVARRTTVDLLVSQTPSGDHIRLRSRFLALTQTDQMVLATPRTDEGRKVFIPSGMDAELSFELGALWFQALTRTLEHGPVPMPMDRRLDALVVRVPQRVDSRRGRVEPRTRLDDAQTLFACVWPMQNVLEETTEPGALGHVVDVSRSGLGLRLNKPCPPRVDQWAAIHLTEANEQGTSLWRGMLRHIVPTDDGHWLAGFANVTELPPGELPILAEHMVTHGRRAVPAAVLLGQGLDPLPDEG